MNLTPARYLLRFDDLCPTMSWSRWEPFEELLYRYKVRPILAVVPENCDLELNFDAPFAGFWVHMRRLEEEGAVIALHGFRHLCLSPGRSLVPLHRFSEFAGVAEGQQIAWLREGLRILRGHDLHPRLFAAPRHGFDHATLRALQAVSLPVLSDGIARALFQRGGVTWIPQQLWEPQPRASGLWTICLHANTSTQIVVARLERFLKQYAARFTSFDEVMAIEPLSHATLSDNLYTSAFLARFRARHITRQIRNAPHLTVGAGPRRRDAS
jgi:predicted deacetylase